MVIVDTREQVNDFVLNYFIENKIEYKSKKIDFGDYKLVGNDDVVVERKQDLLELCGNICSKSHKRFHNELERCVANNCKMFIVIGTDGKINSLKDVSKWKSPVNQYGRRYTKVFGTTLQKAMKTIQDKYGVEYVFVKEQDVGKAIYNILTTFRKNEMNNLYIQDGFLHFDFEKDKKITGTKFASMVDLNPFVKKGDQALELLGILPKDEIDPYLTKRGEIGELLARKLFTQNGYEIQFWDKDEVDYDNFKENKDFGGLIDINLPKANALVEVKSKPLSKKRKIEKEGCVYQELQGKLYAYLKKCDLYMCWVFFNEETEKKIKQDKNFDPYGTNESGKKNCDFYIKKFLYKDFELEMRNLMEQANNYYYKVKKERKIALSDISEKVLERIKRENKVVIYE